MTLLYALGWLLLTLGPLLFFQRRLHFELQAIFLILTRRADIAMALFALIFFPGVLLHELSHYLMARLLGVPTGRISLIPRRLGSGRLQLGVVEAARTDWVRDSLVGAAPLLAGSLLVAYIGLQRMGMLGLWNVWQVSGFVEALRLAPLLTGQSDFWLWFYLAFAISSTMFPSAADRSAWLPAALLLALLVVLSLLLGAGPWINTHFVPLLSQALYAVGLVFAFSLGLHLLLFLPAWGARTLLSSLTGFRVTA